jgi:hypothetical protein
MMSLEQRDNVVSRAVLLDEDISRGLVIQHVALSTTRPLVEKK